mmetsp:Transcript_27464/g.57853  ORF Transcript_27464/g.57853 Transcript_27464/m.57853 type:complete len:105 (+) Transcript_27464:181-495(+)
MGWNTALDGSGTTYYWHSDTGASQYEKPPDFDPATAQASGSYTAYQQNGQSNGSYGSSAYGAGGGGSYGSMGGGYGGGGGGYGGGGGGVPPPPPPPPHERASVL